MVKYNVEGGLDFYSELYGGLDIAETDEATNGVCLISNEKLTEHHVKMKCGHAFNYEPLYKDLVNHKTKFNSMESTSGSLGKNEIRCPYCRTKQADVLPYYADLGLKLVEGVNSSYVPPQPCYFAWENADYDANHPDDCVNPKMIKCNHVGFKVLIKGTNKGTNEDTPEFVFYCAKHNKQILSKQAKELKDKQKQEKEAIRLKEKEAKLAAKVASKANNENVVIASNISIPIEHNPFLCMEILKSGDRKGLQCSVHKDTDRDRCKRHYNLAIKKNL